MTTEDGTDAESQGVPSLIFSSSRVLNTSLDCDALGIHYRITSASNVFGKTDVSTISRWDGNAAEYIPYAQWERSTFKIDRFRFLVENYGLNEGNDSDDPGSVEEAEEESETVSGDYINAKDFMVVTWTPKWGNRSYL